MRHYQPFFDHPQIPQFSTMKIDEGLSHPEDISRSNFKNVIEYVEVGFFNLVRANQLGRGS